jgi:hypothetical protein
LGKDLQGTAKTLVPKWGAEFAKRQKQPLTIKMLCC